MNVLFVEDDDVELIGIQRAFRKAGLQNTIFTARNGLEALDHLRGTTTQPPIAGPLLIFLDLRMPLMDGFQFLTVLRTDPLIRHHVVFVLTTSDDAQDRAQAYARNVAGFITKNDVGMGYERLLDLLRSYARVVELPNPLPNPRS